jgi:hypothetical protein
MHPVLNLTLIQFGGFGRASSAVNCGMWLSDCRRRAGELDESFEPGGDGHEHEDCLTAACRQLEALQAGE